MNKKTILAIILLSPVILFVLFELVYYNKPYPNIYIANTKVSGKSDSDTQKELSAILSLKENQTISYKINQSDTITIKLNKDLLTYELDKSIKDAKQIGRTGTIQNKIKERLNLLTTKTNINPTFDFDELTYDTLLADKIRKYEKQVIETQLIYSNDSFILTPSKPGILANRNKAILDIKEFIEFKNTNSSFNLEFQNINPRTTRENSAAALNKAKQMISRPLTLKSDTLPDQSFTVNTSDIAGFIELKYSANQKTPTIEVVNYKVASYSASISPLIQKNPVDATYEFVNNKVVVTNPAKSGQTLDTIQLATLISDRANNSQLSPIIDLPIKKIAPAITFTALNNLNVKDVLSTGISYFKGSTQARLHNLTLASEKLNGVVIKPNEVFSMYKTIGDIEKSTGFEDSYVLKNGRAVVGVGGGVCQVSTTLFRAALNAGLPIVERHPHSYRVPYYEQQSPPGLDAAIYFPGTDLKFTNNTANNIVIQTKIDTTTNSLEYKFYGISDNRKVTIKNPNIKNIIKPPAQLRLFDDSIQKGIVRQTDYEADGATITINRTIERVGNQITNEIFTSKYRPWQSVFRVGTKEN